MKNVIFKFPTGLTCFAISQLSPISSHLNSFEYLWLCCVTTPYNIKTLWNTYSYDIHLLHKIL